MAINIIDLNIHYSNSTPPSEVYKLKTILRRKGIPFNEVPYRDQNNADDGIKTLTRLFANDLLTSGKTLPLPFNYIVATWYEFPSNDMKLTVGMQDIVALVS